MVRRGGTDDVPAVLGALLCLAGAHVPALTVTVRGEVSYAEIGGTPAVLMQAAAVAALLALLLRRRLLLAAAAAGLWVALLWPLLRFGTERLLRPEPDNPFAQVGRAVSDGAERMAGEIAGDVVPQIVSVHLGALVLLAGCVLVTRGALPRGRRR